MPIPDIILFQFRQLNLVTLFLLKDGSVVKLDCYLIIAFE